MTWQEFEDLSFPEFEALEERRAVRIKYDRYNAAVITSMLMNINRRADVEPITAFDLMGYPKDEAEEERKKLRRSTKEAITIAFMEVASAPPEEIQRIKAAMIAGMEKRGVEDPAGLIREVYPEL